MKTPYRHLSLLTVTAVVLSLATPTVGLAAGPTAPSTAPSTADAALATAHDVPSGTHSVTLITGDVVTTHQSGGVGGTVDVRSADGTPSRARVFESTGNLYVYPDSALPYLAGGILDRRLFNISDLIADGYDDAHRDRLPLIVSYAKAAAGLRPSAPPEGSNRVKDLGSVQGAALTEERARSADFWKAVTAATPAGSRTSAADSPESGKPAFAAGIARIWLDGLVEPDLADTTAQIGAPQAWADGDTGQGVDVAVLDTGVDTEHPDLAGRIATTQSFVPDEDVTDRNGHGTHVASTIAGTGAASDGKEKGVAPGADLHIGKVLSNGGYGQDSWVLAGMEWAAVDQHAKVINMSLGSADPSDGTDPMSEAVNRLSAQTGALFVVAAGNAGGPNSVGAPGAADAALTVGAVDSSDNLAWFSSQGPRAGDGGLKPEISAPGVDVLAARSQYSPLGEGSYQTLSGTSMAAPHVAGAAALLAAVRPDLTGSQLKDLLVSSSKQTPQYDAFQAGSGRVDVPSALHATVFSSASAFAGQVTAGSPVQRPVTYTNTSDSAVTLGLSVRAPSAPVGMFRLSASSVVVPAHGTAQVTVTIDGSQVSSRNSYSGQIIATDAAGAVAAHTAVSLGAGSHKLTMIFKDAQGEPMSGVVELLSPGRFDPDFIIVDGSGKAEMYLPNDVYSVLSFKDVAGVHGPHSMGMALLGDPDVTLDKDTTITLDASKIRRIDMTTPQKTEATYQRLDYQRSIGGGLWRDFMETQTSYDSLWAQPTTGTVTHGDFYLAARWRKEQPALSVATKTTDFTDVLRQANVTPLPQGRFDLPVVVAGNGASADYAGLDARGKAVVVRRNSSVRDADQATAAIQAGAKLLLVVNDEPGRQIRSYSPGFRSPPAKIDVALLSTDEGEKLIQQTSSGKAKLSVESQPVAQYLYDLMQTWHNQIPDSMVVQGSAENLARVDVTFDSPDPTRGGGEFRYDWPSYNDWGVGNMMPEPVNGKRVDWVSTGGAYTWGQEAYVDGLLFEIGPRTSYRAGSSQTEHWFRPIERPYLNNNYKSAMRNGNTMRLDVPAWGGSDHVGMTVDYERTQQTLTLYQGNTKLAEAGYLPPYIQTNVPASGELPYRLVLDASRDASVSPYSSTTHTEWGFTSKAPSADESTVLPLLQLDYEIDTDAVGKTSRGARLAVSAAHLPGAVGVGTISPVTVEMSFDDGRTWQTSTCDNDGRFRLPETPDSAQFISLRASASDSAGNTITQTVIRAFGLR